MLLGAFTWDGETRSFGMIVNQAPKPASFTFDFKSNLRAGSTKLGFSDGAVTDITNLPLDGAERADHSRARAAPEGRASIR